MCNHRCTWSYIVTYSYDPNVGLGPGVQKKMILAVSISSIPFQ